MEQLGQAITTTASSVDGLIRSVSTLGKDNSLKQTMTYIDNLGRKYTERYKDGILEGITVADTGDLKEMQEQFSRITKDYEKLMRLRTELAKSPEGSKKESVLATQVAQQERLVDVNERYIESLRKTGEAERQVAKYRAKQAELQDKLRRDTASTETRDYEQEAVKAIKEQISLTEKLYKVKAMILQTEDEGEKAKLQGAEAVYTTQLAAQEQILQTIKAQHPELQNNAAVQKEESNLILKKAQAESQYGKEVEKNNEKVRQSESLLSKVADTAVRMATVWASNALRAFWTDGIKYASQYYDLMNEIRIVTGMSEGDADKLGQDYRRLAEEMKVSSTDIAKAAVEFWRQGVSDDKVATLAKDTTMYAKITG